MARIPPLLQPCLELPPQDSLLLLTSTVGASANWLIVRFLSHALSTIKNGSGADERYNVVLVSWMRDLEFWKQEARKGAGLDLGHLMKTGRFAFIDGLSELSIDELRQQTGNLNEPQAKEYPGQITNHSTTPQAGVQSRRGLQSLPVRGPILPARPPGSPRNPMQQNTVSPSTTTISATTKIVDQNQKADTTLTSPELPKFVSAVHSTLSALRPPASPPVQEAGLKTVIVLDNPDLLLALDPTLTPATLASTLLTIHAIPNVSHILTHIQADDPLLGLSSPPQPLELAHHNFLVKYAHMSRRIMGVRVLDTGVAKDVSGVLRITHQEEDLCNLKPKGSHEYSNDDSKKGKEFLYQIRGDGSVKVFERGAGGDG